MSPRTANTIEVVTSDTQLVTKSLDLFMGAAILTERCAGVKRVVGVYHPRSSSSGGCLMAVMPKAR
jgi:hypothetical protein